MVLPGPSMDSRWLDAGLDDRAASIAEHDGSRPLVFFQRAAFAQFHGRCDVYAATRLLSSESSFAWATAWAIWAGRRLEEAKLAHPRATHWTLRLHLKGYRGSADDLSRACAKRGLLWHQSAFIHAPNPRLPSVLSVTIPVTERHVLSVEKQWGSEAGALDLVRPMIGDREGWSLILKVLGHTRELTLEILDPSTEEVATTATTEQRGGLFFKANDAIRRRFSNPVHWTDVYILNAHWLTAPGWARLQSYIAKQRHLNLIPPNHGRLVLFICPVFEYANGHRIGRLLAQRAIGEMENLMDAPNRETRQALRRIDQILRHRGQWLVAIPPPIRPSPLLSASSRLYSAMTTPDCRGSDLLCPGLDRALHWYCRGASLCLGLLDRPWTELDPRLLDPEVADAELSRGHPLDIHASTLRYYYTRDQIYGLLALMLLYPTMRVRLHDPKSEKMVPLSIILERLESPNARPTLNWPMDV